MSTNEIIDFDKLFLVKDSEYGTHVTYIKDYPYHLFIDFFTDHTSLFEIIEDINYYISIDKKNK